MLAILWFTLGLWLGGALVFWDASEAVAHRHSRTARVLGALTWPVMVLSS